MNKAKKYKLKLDYTADELEELKELRKDYDSPMYAISKLLIAGTHGVENLSAKYLEMRQEDEFDFMADINNVVMGTAIFSEKKYVVHDSATNQYIYYNKLDESFYWSQLQSRIPEINTKDEWLHINPAYELRLERVESVEDDE